MHWERWKKHGNPLGGRTPNGEAVRFIDTAMQWESDTCLLWPYGTSAGYGWIGSLKRHAHVIICERAHGPRPQGLEACHSCGQKSCVNKRHLRWGTHTINMADFIVEHGSGPNSKLRPVDVMEIRKLFSLHSDKAIAKRYGVSQMTIWNIRKGRTWVHLL